MQNERLLHIALRTPLEGQPALAAMLRSLADQYDDIDWQLAGSTAAARAEAVFTKAKKLRPTVVFMQLQNAEAFTPKAIKKLRELCDPSAVLIDWDGDQYHGPEDPRHAWFIEIGKECDASLVTSTAHPPVYAAAGVPGAGYLQIGIDEELYRPKPPTPGTPEIVFLASRYEHTSHARRTELVQSLYKRYGKRFAVYGHGWESYPFGRPLLKQPDEAGVYCAARCAISMSMRNDLPAYSSDRLFRALASGAVTLVEEFPQLREVIGFEGGIHGLTWKTYDDLYALIDGVLAQTDDYYAEMRKWASDFAREKHSWKARVPELQRIIADVRAQRGV